MLKRTKIVATIGPSSDKKEILEKMIESGMNVARINFSHGTYASNGKVMKMIRLISENQDTPIGIIADLQGPRIRTVVDEDLEIKKGEVVKIFDTSSTSKLQTLPTGRQVNSKSQAQSSKRNARYQISDTKYFSLDWPGITEGVSAGNEILIEDGLMRLKAVKKRRGLIEAEVIEGGIIKNHKGVNIPDAKLNIPALTEKDEKDLEFALSCDVDFVALSFVSNAREIEDVRKKISNRRKRGSFPPSIISKIERKEAIKNIDEIIAASDAVMVARGDLGIELDESKVVLYQKEITAKCLRSGKPVIVATQMLNSMIESARPTRAEVSDVSNAVIDHTDAVMLSGETASGKYPVEAVRTMKEIIEHTEESPFDDLVHGFLGDSRSSVSAAVANSAHELAKDSNADAIVVASVSGFTAGMIARHRPEQKIFVMTNSARTHNQLSLFWGTESFILPDCKNLDDLIDKSVKTLVRRKKLSKKDRIVIVTGRPHIKKEHMSLVKVEEIK